MSGALIALDWGTTHVRSALLARDGSAIEERDGKSGVGSLDAAGFQDRYGELTEGWPTLPAIACGMVGSRQGWTEADYLACPTGFDELAQRLTTVEAGTGQLSIVPGLKIDRDGRSDVMRGEETQVAGLLAQHPQFEGTAVLPGSHSKWVRIERGQIVDFRTYLTGELFEAIASHTILRHSTADDDEPAGTKDDMERVFRTAVAEAITGPGSALGRLFPLRANGLLHGVPNAVSRERLSGLLIGMELAAATQDGFDVQDVVIIGGPKLTARYALAGSALSAEMVERDGAHLVWPALFDIARRTGLIGDMT